MVSTGAPLELSSTPPLDVSLDDVPPPSELPPMVDVLASSPALSLAGDPLDEVLSCPPDDVGSPHATAPSATASHRLMPASIPAQASPGDREFHSGRIAGER
jgi:hypothetical protein